MFLLVKRIIIFLAVIGFNNGIYCLDVRLPPTVTRGPVKSIIFKSDDSITLECEAEAVPGVTYEWTKNGNYLNLNLPHIKQGADGTITIQYATTLDEGYYQCFAKNQYGTALSDVLHLQKAFLQSFSGNRIAKRVREGESFHLVMEPIKSFPKPIYSWEMLQHTMDINPVPFILSKRVQFANNGDLHFAYAMPEDEKLYRCTAYNQYLDVRVGGCYTNVTVERVSGSAFPFAPSLAFSSESLTVAIIGGSVALRCFFSGYPYPMITWMKNKSTLPIGRYNLAKFNSEFTITNIQATDDGNYTCMGQNLEGNIQHTLQIKVEAAPTFRVLENGPHNTNATDGDTVTFNCNADALPEAKIVWLQDGVELNVNNLPRRFILSNNAKSLTIRDVCQVCDDRNRGTDLTVIQCNASNVHGYAFRSGYLNVIARTRIIPEGNLEVLVKFDEERRFDFECNAVSDPSTPPIVRWYKMDDKEERAIYEEPPEITIKNGTLSIHVSPNGTTPWTKFGGEYRCVASNGYSTATRTVRLLVEEYIGPISPHSPPVFKTMADRPHDINVTVDESVSFNCNAYAIPEAKIAWFENGVELNETNLPRRFALSNDRKRLTIKGVCRNCDDREDRGNGLTLIQCIASNIHGNALGSGFLNVLDERNQASSVTFLSSRLFIFLFAVIAVPFD